MKTWKIEMLMVAVILLTVNIIAKKLFTIEMLAALAVLITFGYVQIADRMAEQESIKNEPTVFCYKKMWYYSVGKEMLWFLYFLLNHSYSALVGVVIFLGYPIWRSLYRRRFKKLVQTNTSTNPKSNSEPNV